jgi:hypothetical protein
LLCNGIKNSSIYGMVSTIEINVSLEMGFDSLELIDVGTQTRCMSSQTERIRIKHCLM